MTKQTFSVNDVQADMLVEVASIAANHAAGALSKLIDERIHVQVPLLQITEIEKARDIIGEAEQHMTGIAIPVDGEARGVVFLLLDPNDAQKLVSSVAKDMQNSALEEIANIITGAALGSLQRFLGLKFAQTVPGSATDMLGAVVDDIVADAGNRADHILLLGMQFVTGQDQVRGKLYFIFDPPSTQVIAKACAAKTKTSAS